MTSTPPYQQPPEQPQTSETDVGTLPDNNTSEAILYGKEYSRIKTIMWAWDEIEDYLWNQAQGLESEIIDRRFAYHVLTTNRNLIYARSPPFNEINKLKDLFTLRKLVKCCAAIRRIQRYRKANLTYARKQGIQQYVSSLAGKGISPSDWKHATAKYNMEPIDFATVNGNVELSPEDDVDWQTFLHLLMGDKPYEKYAEEADSVSVGRDGEEFPEDGEFFGEAEGDEDGDEDDPEDTDEDDDSEDGDEDDDDSDEASEDGEETEGDEDAPSPEERAFWTYVDQHASVIADDRVYDIISLFPEDDPEDVQAALDYLEGVGPSDHDIVRHLTQFAQGVEE